MRSAAAFVLCAASVLGGCSNGGSAFAPLAAGAIARPTSKPSATPTALPSPSPPVATPTPGTLTASPTSVTIGNGNPTSTTVAISETAYGGQFSESDDCTGIATVSLSPLSGPNATLSVAQIAAGACIVQIDDNHGGAIGVNVTSTTSTVIIESQRRP